MATWLPPPDDERDATGDLEDIMEEIGLNGEYHKFELIMTRVIKVNLSGDVSDGCIFQRG